MSRRMVQAIDVIAFTVLVVAGLMIAAGMAHAEQTSASARKVDRPAVTASIAPMTATIATLDASRQTTTLVRGPVDF